MMSMTRLSQTSLRPFVKMLWAVEASSGSQCVEGAREHVLPTGGTHLVFRLSDSPLRIFRGVEDACGQTFGHAIVGGVRSTFYVRDISTLSCSVGALLHPGAAEALLGAGADELSERHTPLFDLWGRAASLAHERLLAVNGAERRLAVFETLLTERLPVATRWRPAIAHAIERLESGENIRAVVADSGYSHRHFIALFRRAVGLSPRRYGRLVRFQQVLKLFTAGREMAFVDLAIDAGYSDQPHFNRAFRAFSGVTPGEYRKIAPVQPNHVWVNDPTRGQRDRGQFHSRLGVKTAVS